MLFIATTYHARVFSFCHVFRNVIIWYGCHFAIWQIDIGSNSKMKSISYNYNTEYTTKWIHSLAWYDVAINSTIKPVFCWLSFKLLFVCQIWWPNGLGTRLVIQRSWVRVPLWTRIFHFVILGFRSLQPELAYTNEINHGILRANTLF